MWLVVGFYTLVSQPKPASTDFVPGEAIVAFKADTDPGRALAALAQGKESSRPRLDQCVAQLSEAVAIPLTIRRVGSGGELRLAVDFQQLAARLKARLENLSDVATVRPTLDEAPERVRVEATVATKAGAGSAWRLSARIVADSEWPVSAQPASGRTLLVKVDLNRLTLLLVERLGKRPEVAHAQPNYRVQKAPRGN
jgi:hypothetical protein